MERTRQATTQGIFFKLQKKNLAPKFKLPILFAGGPVTVSLGVPGTNYVPTVTAVTSGSFPLHFERISEVNSSSNPSHHPQVIFFLILKKKFHGHPQFYE